MIGEIADRLNASTGGPIAVALASTHGNGRVRERAVAQMLEQPTSELMPFLVLRTSDWVRQVRDRARAGLAVLLHDNPAAYLPTAVGMALLAQSRQRGSFARTQVLAGALETPPNMIKVLVTSPDRAVRRFAFDTGMAAHWFRIDDLTVIAETDADIRLRAQAADRPLPSRPTRSTTSVPSPNTRPPRSARTPRGYCKPIWTPRQQR
jgi:hypothetical protein